ncbi:hypothetical protein D3C74_469810 [compost metagenome]
MKGDEVLHGRKLNSFDGVSNVSAHVHNLYTVIQPFGYEIVTVHSTYVILQNGRPNFDRCNGDKYN